jgi:hypothetical protein
MTARKEPSEPDRVLVSEAPYYVGDLSPADLPDDLLQELGAEMIRMGIEHDADCPKCKHAMDIWNVPYPQPILRRVEATGHMYTQTHHDIFYCPACGYRRDRKIGREDPEVSQL